MKNKRVIFLNGPMGAGKTTVGRLIQRSLAGCAFIDGDWCMDLEPFVGNSETRALEEGAAKIGLETAWFTLLCTEEALGARWRGDKLCPWRTEENLRVSVRSLEAFSRLPGVPVDTSGMTAEQVRDHILKHL